MFGVGRATEEEKSKGGTRKERRKEKNTSGYLVRQGHGESRQRKKGRRLFL